MMLTPDDIGCAVLELARERGWSRNQLASRAGISVGVLTHWYSGNRIREPTFPSVRLLCYVAEALGMPLSELIRQAEARARQGVDPITADLRDMAALAFGEAPR